MALDSIPQAETIESARRTAEKPANVGSDAGVALMAPTAASSCRPASSHETSFSGQVPSLESTAQNTADSSDEIQQERILKRTFESAIGEEPVPVVVNQPPAQDPNDGFGNYASMLRCERLSMDMTCASGPLTSLCDIDELVACATTGVRLASSMPKSGRGQNHSRVS